MNRKRIFAIGKLVVLFGTPLALILGLFSCGVYCGVDNRASITRFERDWLGLDVEVPEASPPEEGKDAKSTEPKAEGKAPPEGKSAEAKAAEAKAAEAKAAETKAAETKAAETKAAEATPPAVVPTTPSQPGGVPAPVAPPDARVDPLDQAHEDRLAASVTVWVKVLVDQSLIDAQPDWIDYVQRTISAASHIYEQQFGIRLQLASVGRWTVPPEGMGASDLLADLEAHRREGASVLVGFTNRPFDGSTSGTAETPFDDSPFNGAYGVVYATPGHRRAHLRTLLHEVAHMFGARDVTDPQSADWQAGSWMSYASVPEAQELWIDRPNRQRVIDRKDRPFAPDTPAPPSAPVEP